MMKRGLSLLLIPILCISLLTAIGPNANAAEITYTYDDEYIYNWGVRGETATFLSPNAVAFYESNASYDELSSYAGGTSVSNAPQSELYFALQDLMVDAHDVFTSYDGTKALYRYTDCQGGGGRISSFYSGKQIGPSWDDGGWNREHTWPNSKGLGGKDENDIMMLRPTSTSENSSRGNTAYGKSSGYYDPNSESGGTYDLRGDVARIFLYVYVRWGNTSGNGEYATWGRDGVMESVTVLLEWMADDPVDTWELGRNDSVESITGTRNVFVDYPELAFLLFGEEIPEDMTTPSYESGLRCDHDNYDAGVVVAATCTKKGYTLYTCQTAGCGGSYKASITEAKGHSYSTTVTAPTCTKEGFTTYTCSRCTHSYTDNRVAKSKHTYKNDVCTVCGGIKSASTKATIRFADVQNRTEFSTSMQVWEQNGITVTNNKARSQSNVADYKNPARFYMGSDVIIRYPGITKIEINCTGLESKYVSGWLNAPTGATATKTNGIVTVVLDSPTDSVTYTNLSAQCRAYDITVYAEAAALPSCTHTNTAVEGAVAPSCSATGHTGKTRCLDCDTIVNEGQSIPTAQHSWAAADCDTPKTCSVCHTTEGSALGHAWTDATSDAPKTCERCGIAEGENHPGTAPDNDGTSGGSSPEGDDAPNGGNNAEKDHSQCTASGFKTFWNAIANFFRRLFGNKEKCVCGAFYGE